MSHTSATERADAPVVSASLRGTSSWWVFAAVAAACLLRGAGEFAYDARAYWHANLFVFGAGELTVADYFDLRGVWTAVTFAPAAAVTAIFGDSVAGFAVLLQNAVLIAWAAAFLVPRAVAPWRAPSTRVRWVGAVLCTAVLLGFAPYPMVDLYAAVAALAAVVLLRARSAWGLVGAGALLGYAMNVRPAYVPAVVLLLVAATFARRGRALWILPGVVAASLPQALANAVRHGSLSPLPVASDALVALQASAASFVVRYDTAPGREASPQQFFCSPSMASTVDSLPTTTGDLVATYLRHLPESLVFAVEKVGAALHWPLSVPYLVSNPGIDALFAVAITLVAVVGCAALAVGPLLRRSAVSRDGWDAWAGMTAVVVASVATLAGSAAEARFALPLVLLGVVGVAGLTDATPRAVVRHRWSVTSVVVVAVVLVAAGYAGLAHPAPPGPATQEICAES